MMENSGSPFCDFAIDHNLQDTRPNLNSNTIGHEDSLTRNGKFWWVMTHLEANNLWKSSNHLPTACTCCAHCDKSNGLTDGDFSSYRCWIYEVFFPFHAHNDKI